MCINELDANVVIFVIMTLFIEGFKAFNSYATVTIKAYFVSFSYYFYAWMRNCLILYQILCTITWDRCIWNDLIKELLWDAYGLTSTCGHIHIM